LLKFEMVSRIKILMASGFKKRTQIYFSFPSKVSANDLRVPQQGPCEERGPFTGHFAYLSKTSSFRFPSKGALPQGPLHGIPHREMPHH
jgi:hypothetical protein